MTRFEELDAQTRFNVLNRFLGWGNPQAPFWFIGLEEFSGWPEHPTKKDCEAFDKYMQGPWLAVQEGEIQKAAQIYQIMSKLVLELTERRYERWNTYRFTGLFIDGRTCQANLFPLGKSGLNKWPPHYEKLFGFSRKNHQQYMEKVRGERFPLLREQWKEFKPVITVCFGKAGWDDFRILLEPGKKEDEFEDCELYSSGIVFTPFFNYKNGMTKSRIHAVAEHLRPAWERSTSHHVPH